MTSHRRSFLIGVLAVCTGCTALTASNDSGGDEETSTSDFTADDIVISNERDKKATVNLVFNSEADKETNFELMINIRPDDVVIWEENKLLNNAGGIEVTLQGGSGEKQSDTVFWEGDTPDDSHRLDVTVDDDGISVSASVI